MTQGSGEAAAMALAIGNSPIDYHNRVVHADLTAEETHREISERMRVHGVPGKRRLCRNRTPDTVACAFDVVDV